MVYYKQSRLFGTLSLPFSSILSMDIYTCTKTIVYFLIVIRALVESRTENWTTYTAVYSVQVLDVLKVSEDGTISKPV